MEKTIYLDHAATTPLDREVFEKMMPWFTDHYGNPSSIYRLGRTAKNAVEQARDQVAALINSRDSEVFFTSGGTESDNWAIKGVAYANKDKGRHIVTTNIEHHAVYDTCRHLEKNGFTVTYVPVGKNGIVDPSDIQKAIGRETILITVMAANNEIGTIQPIQDIGGIARERNIIFHTDAVQTAGTLPIDVKKLQVDMLSLSAHKFYGPKGTGVLYVRKGTKMDSLFHGGGQEKTRRASTENVPGIVGLSHALEKANKNMDRNNTHLKKLRDELVDRVLGRIPFTIYNGDRDLRLPGNANFAFEFVEGESLLLLLDHLGIMASSGSACTSGSLEPSHVLLALGLTHEVAHGSLRVSFGLDNHMGEIGTIVDAIASSVEKLRDMSPLYEDHLKRNRSD
ncbi:MAG: cysteine desulfurase NifS [Clostridia bacterium]